MPIVDDLGSDDERKPLPRDLKQKPSPQEHKPAPKHVNQGTPIDDWEDDDSVSDAQPEGGFCEGEEEEEEEERLDAYSDVDHSSWDDFDDQIKAAEATKA